eukprot:13493871-Alexandrium_andersonii.AAC.1
MSERPSRPRGIGAARAPDAAPSVAGSRLDAAKSPTARDRDPKSSRGRNPCLREESMNMLK